MPRYKPEVFDATSLEQAKAIILTADDTMSTQQRWERETPIVADQLSRDLNITAEHLVLDYGCGIGRLAKVLIQRHRCAVVGVDIAVSMLQLAPGYTASARFAAMAPEMLDLLVARGVRFDSAYAIWVIQHCAKPADDLRRIAAALKPDGAFEVLNCRHRCVPTDQGWLNDEIDLVPLLQSLYSEVKLSPVPPGITPLQFPDVAYFATCRGPKAG